MIANLAPYPAYKDSGVEWLGEVPEHWEVPWLGQFGTLSKGNGGNKGDEVPSGIPCVRYGGRCRAWTGQNGCVPRTFMLACDM